MPSRREFLIHPARGREPDLASAGADAATFSMPSGNTVRLTRTAMACDFEVILNAEPRAPLAQASGALDLLDALEDQMSVYRSNSELTRLNSAADRAPQVVEPRLFDLLREAIGYAGQTGGAYDPTAGPLVALWRVCRREKRAPAEAELAAARSRLGFREVFFDETRHTVAFGREGIELNLNAIGKGYALDRMAESLLDTPRDWLMHAGHSSILAKGRLSGHSGWPISLSHPLFPGRRLGEIVLRDRGLSTSGSAVQFFRAGGRKFGHLLDPRTGWPGEDMLCAIVLAPTAAQAEALSTAFFVLGVEKSRAYCHNHEEVAALLVPAATGRGGRIEPVNCGIPESDFCLDVSQPVEKGVWNSPNA